MPYLYISSNPLPLSRAVAASMMPVRGRRAASRSPRARHETGILGCSADLASRPGVFFFCFESLLSLALTCFSSVIEMVLRPFRVSVKPYECDDCCVILQSTGKGFEQISLGKQAPGQARSWTRMIGKEERGIWPALYSSPCTSIKVRRIHPYTPSQGL